MMKFSRWIAVAALTTSIVAQAQTLSVATGAKSGTYMQMAQQLATACPQPQQQLIESTGSVQNIESLVGNKVNMAWVQSDMLFFTKATDEAKVANIRTLAGMHPEELHFIARADVKKEGGYGIGKYKIGGQEITFTTLSDLTGRPIGAVGGSVLSGRVVSQYGNLRLDIREYPSNDALKAALLDGAVDAILVVGGAPHPLVQSLDGRFRILPVSDGTARALKDVYTPAKLTYSNLGASGVDTIATQALLVSRVYRSADMAARLRQLRECFVKQLDNIKDATGTHPKWQQVEISNPGKWPMYEFK